MPDAALDALVEVVAGTQDVDVVVAVACKDAAATLLTTSEVIPKADFLPPLVAPSAHPQIFQEVSKAVVPM
jgi:hypothetical protein